MQLRSKTIIDKIEESRIGFPTFLILLGSIILFRIFLENKVTLPFQHSFFSPVFLHHSATFFLSAFLSSTLLICILSKEKVGKVSKVVLFGLRLDHNTSNHRLLHKQNSILRLHIRPQHATLNPKLDLPHKSLPNILNRPKRRHNRPTNRNDSTTNLRNPIRLHKNKISNQNHPHPTISLHPNILLRHLPQLRQLRKPIQDIRLCPQPTILQQPLHNPNTNPRNTLALALRQNKTASNHQKNGCRKNPSLLSNGRRRRLDSRNRDPTPPYSFYYAHSQVG